MALYTHTTFGQAKQRLASLLGADAFWTPAELGTYLVEALRWWGLAAQYWRESARLTLQPGQGFYDVAQLEMAGGGLAQSLTVTDREVINDACYNLMEPPVTDWLAGWPGSEMFGLGEIANVLSLSRDDLLKLSGCVASEVVYPVAGGAQRVELADDTVHILRASIEELGDAEDGNKYPLWPVDQNQAQASRLTGRPVSYALTYTPTLSVDLFPAARTQSNLRLYVVEAGAELTPTTGATALGLPDDACWIAKYRLMDDLLSGDGLARAPEISEYCRRRWLEGVEMLAQYQSLMWSTVGGRRMTLSSVGQLDAQRPDWQATWGTPRSLHLLNWNLFAVYPLVNEATVVEVEVVRKAPVPVDDTDYLQVGREQLQAIYDYAQHIAMMKCQGAEFAATAGLYKTAREAARNYMAAQAGTSVNWAQQQRLTRQERVVRPYGRPGLVDEAGHEAKEAA